MQTELFSQDITFRKHKGNPASIDANTRASKTKARDAARILQFAIKVGGRVWLKQIERELEMLRNSVSARLAELKAAGVLVPTEERAEGCTVLRLVIK